MRIYLTIFGLHLVLCNTLPCSDKCRHWQPYCCAWMPPGQGRLATTALDAQVPALGH